MKLDKLELGLVGHINLWPKISKSAHRHGIQFQKEGLWNGGSGLWSPVWLCIHNALPVDRLLQKWQKDPGAYPAVEWKDPVCETQWRWCIAGTQDVQMFRYEPKYDMCSTVSFHNLKQAGKGVMKGVKLYIYMNTAAWTQPNTSHLSTTNI